jgi:hypothetical protein
MEKLVEMSICELMGVVENEKEILLQCNIGGPRSMTSPYICVPPYNIFSSLINGKNISNTVTEDVVGDYRKVYEIDNSILEYSLSDYDIGIAGFFIDDVYQGSTWFIIKDDHPQHLTIYGIRPSLVNTLLGKTDVVKKIMSMFIDGRSMVGKISNMIVPYPISLVGVHLAGMGFFKYRIPMGEDGSYRHVYKMTSPPSSDDKKE